MNRETTATRSRAELARLVTDALERVAAAAQRKRDRHAGAWGLSDAKLEVLGLLSCCDDRRACLHTLGDELGVTRPNITKLVDGLERGGLVERLPHPSDGRMVQANLTPEGARLAETALPGRDALVERVWEPLDDDELSRLAEMLERVARSCCAPRSAERG
jgi:DNA-binding MarR family transcriptional regulator